MNPNDRIRLTPKGEAMLARITPDDMEKAFAVAQRPEFWCRAKLFQALEAARVRGVLSEVLGEMDLADKAVSSIETHLKQHWRRRCSHGMFRSGAGACPQCGGGAS